MLPVTFRDNKLVAKAGQLGVTVWSDFRRWWLLTTSPPALRVWLAARTPVRIPADNDRLRLAWRVDHWTTGLLLVAVSTALFLTAAGVRWVACHPARRWAFLILTATTTALWLA